MFLVSALLQLELLYRRMVYISRQINILRAWLTICYLHCENSTILYNSLIKTLADTIVSANPPL